MSGRRSVFVRIRGAALLSARALVLPWSPSSILAADDEQLYMRVVDAGAGICCVIDAPSSTAGERRYIVYDAGNFVDQGATAIETIREIMRRLNRALSTDH